MLIFGTLWLIGVIFIYIAIKNAPEGCAKCEEVTTLNRLSLCKYCEKDVDLNKF